MSKSFIFCRNENSSHNKIDFIFYASENKSFEQSDSNFNITDR